MLGSVRMFESNRKKRYTQMKKKIKVFLKNIIRYETYGYMLQDFTVQ